MLLTWTMMMMSRGILQGENTLCVSQWGRRVGEVHRAYIGQCYNPAALLSWSTTPLFYWHSHHCPKSILDNDAMLSWWITPLFTVKININVHNIYWWQVIVDRWVLFQSIVQYMLFSSLTLIVILTSHLCHPFSWSLSFLMFLFWPIRAQLVFSQMFLFCAGFALIRKKLGDYSFLSPKHSSDKKGLTDI